MANGKQDVKTNHECNASFDIFYGYFYKYKIWMIFTWLKSTDFHTQNHYAIHCASFFLFLGLFFVRFHFVLHIGQSYSLYASFYKWIGFCLARPWRCVQSICAICLQCYFSYFCSLFASIDSVSFCRKKRRKKQHNNNNNNNDVYCVRPFFGRELMHSTMLSACTSCALCKGEFNRAMNSLT